MVVAPIGVSTSTLERWRSEALAQPGRERIWTESGALRCRVEHSTDGRGQQEQLGPCQRRLPCVVRGMLDGRSNSYVEEMNGLLQQTKRTARGFGTVANFVPIAYLRMA